MPRTLLKVDGHKLTQFRLEQLLKHKPIQLARRLIDIYGNEAEDIVKCMLPECLEKEKFRVSLHQQVKEVATNRWNRGIAI